MLSKFGRESDGKKHLELRLQILKHGADAGLLPTKHELSQPAAN